MPFRFPRTGDDHSNIQYTMLVAPSSQLSPIYIKKWSAEFGLELDAQHWSLNMGYNQILHPQYTVSESNYKYITQYFVLTQIAHYVPE